MAAMFRRRLRTITLWTGTLLSLLIAVAFVVSAWLLLSIEILGGGFVMAVGGMVILGVDDLYSVIWHAELVRRPNLALPAVSASLLRALVILRPD